MKNILVLAAMTGLAAQAEGTTAPAKAEESVECFGINSCKGTGKCSVSGDQIAMANKHFKNKFEKTKEGHECAGSNACGGKDGHLAWVSEKSADDCHKKGGFTFQKGKDGKLTISAPAAAKKKKG